VLSVIPSIPQLLLYPTGAGSPVKLERGPVATYRYVAQWFADGTRVLFCGTEKSGAAHCYQQRIDDGPPTPVTPDGTDFALLAQDDATLLYRTAANEYMLTSLGGSTAPRRVPGLTAADRPLAFTRDTRSVFVQAGTSIPLRVERVDVSSGARAPVAELAPPDRSGVTSLRVDQWADDGRVYTYRMVRMLSTLYVVEAK
jgi:hypothetical protein